MSTSPIRRFNTHDTPDDAILSLETGRAAIREQIFDLVKLNIQAGTGQLQHVLVRAPRGFGKSYMTRLIEIDSRGLANEGAAVSYALLPEEQRNVSSPASLLKEIRRIVTGEGWDQVTSMWDDDEDAWDNAVAALDAALDEVFSPGQGLLIAVIENLDSLMSDIFKADVDQQALRKWITRKGNRIMLFATATGSVDVDYDKPLFQAFETIHLLPWHEDDCIDYFKALRQFKGQPELSDEQIAKARAISGFIGGNPRLARLLGDVITTEDVLSVAETLDGLVDELADYYRRRIDDLTAKARTLLDALIRGGEPCSQSELAERVGTQQNRVARAFAELQRNQIVVGKKVTGGRETLYRVTDRVFVHFYRTRYGGVAREDSPLLAITDLLKTFFTTDEKREKAGQFLDEGMLKEGRLLADLASAEEGGNRSLYSYLNMLQERFEGYLLAVEAILVNPLGQENRDDLIQAILNLEDSAEQTYSASQIALSGELPNEVNALWLILMAASSLNLGLQSKTQHYFQQAVDKAGDVPELVCIANREFGLYLSRIAQDNVATNNRLGVSGEQAEFITSPVLAIRALGDKAFALADDFPEKALSFFQQASTMAKKVGDSRLQVNQLRFIACILVRLARYEEALDTACKAITLAEKTNDSYEKLWLLDSVAYSLWSLNRYGEAVEIGDQAIALSKEVGYKPLQAQALWCVTQSFKALEQYSEALDSIRAGLACVAGSPFKSERFEQTWLIIELLTLAGKVIIPDCVLQFRELIAISRLNSDNTIPKPFARLRLLFLAATRAKQWFALIQLWQQEKEDFEIYIGYRDTDAPGHLLCKIIQEGDRAQAYACAVDFILALAPEIKSDPGAVLHSIYPQKVVNASLNVLLAQCEDPEFLSDIADLLQTTFTSHFRREIDLFKAAAVYHQSNRDPASLERTDPDISTALLRMWGGM
ncbi:MAG: tetratricopeptide (TPR) repeat protein [Phenylobacterium sp.]|jgi:tetratricopeptide (TPR) repeat protein